MSTTPGPDGAHAAGRPADTRTSGTDHTVGDHRAGDRPVADHPAADHPVGDRRDVVAAQKERYGGIKWGSAFFGWLTATGTALLLTALAAATGAAFGLAQAPAGPGQAADQAGQAVQDPGTAQTVGLVGAIVLLVILFLAYYCGGYVAGRMARFNGAKQGLAVWVWAIIAAAIVAILGAVAGAQFDVLANLGGLPRLPIDEGSLTTGGIIAALVALAASLIGAVLGGLAGMRYHRKIDRVGYDH
ncbi:MAG TPA: hypothetical protein VM367_16690 [Pseudonocardia sp.]|jgi:hypothetical protein|nr:hypothetical protein [Pseudonocardia sp.]